MDLMLRTAMALAVFTVIYSKSKFLAYPKCT